MEHGTNEDDVVVITSYVRHAGLALVPQEKILFDKSSPNIVMMFSHDDAYNIIYTTTINNTLTEMKINFRGY